MNRQHLGKFLHRNILSVIPPFRGLTFFFCLFHPKMASQQYASENVHQITSLLGEEQLIVNKERRRILHKCHLKYFLCTYMFCILISITFPYNMQGTTTGTMSQKRHGRCRRFKANWRQEHEQATLTEYYEWSWGLANVEALEMAGGIKVCRREMRKWEHQVGSIWGYLCAHL